MSADTRMAILHGGPRNGERFPVTPATYQPVIEGYRGRYVADAVDLSRDDAPTITYYWRDND